MSKQYDVVLMPFEFSRPSVGSRLHRLGFANQVLCYYVRKGKILRNHKILVGVGEWRNTQFKQVKEAWVDGEKPIVHAKVWPINWHVDGGNTFSTVAINEVTVWYPA